MNFFFFLKTLIQIIAWKYISRDDSFHASKKVCKQIRQGSVAIFGPSDDRLGMHVQSICDSLDIPHLESRKHNLNFGKEFSINLHPGSFAVAQSVRVLITFLNWTRVAVIYEDDMSMWNIDYATLSVFSLGNHPIVNHKLN